MQEIQNKIESQINFVLNENLSEMDTVSGVDRKLLWGSLKVS